MQKTIMNAIVLVKVKAKLLNKEVPKHSGLSKIEICF